MAERLKAGGTYTTLFNLVIIYFAILGILLSYGGGSRVSVMMGAFVLTAFVLIKQNSSTQRMIVSIVVISLVLWLTESFLYRYRGTRLPTFAPSILMSIYTSMLLGFVMVYYPIKLRWLKILMYIFLIWCFYMVVFLRTPIDQVFTSETSSGVGLLSLTLSLIIPVAYLEYRDYHKISILPFFLQMVISFFVTSRTGLGTCVMLFCFALFAGVYKMKNRFIRILSFVILGVVVAGVGYMVTSNSSGMEGVSKMVEMGSDLTGRDLIWANYFFNFDINDLIYGRDIVGLNEGEWQNAHCSWIQLHSSVGFLAIVVMLITIVALVYYLLRDLPLALILFSLIVYATFNYIFFFNLNDRLLYMFLFHYLLVRKTDRPANKQPVKMTLI